ncbi:hypothetical protein [Priestia megaterium]|uniref:hypothetical protein n=1 Tax=Priestia megaterium TaxID=1404 RepID=UPI00203AFBA6|nr:hypothetical protein [Priestia megaterium]MCM3197044.1 hypothetical protein [Priestia megaterium]
MEILMKSFEWRFHPAGHVYKTEVNSLGELQMLFSCYCSDDWKRAGEAYFKTEKDDKWLEYEEFIWKYFKDALRLPQYECEELELIGFEEANGRFKSIEEWHEEGKKEKEKSEEPSRKERLDKLTSYKERIDKELEELKKELEYEEMVKES